ncbi:MAG: four helix bundle protein [Patescibacteria group bacterium]|jgi:four helix bundle protein
MFRFETLEIWKEAIIFVNKIYLTTEKNFPKHELYALTSQVRRAAISVSANIAEGSANDSIRGFKLFLNYSIRSLVEVISELYIARDREYINNQDFNSLYLNAEVLVKRITCFKKSL